MQVVVRMNPRKLTSHPLNATLYDEVVVDDFVASIKKEGVLTPLIITPKNVIVSGHRRQQAAVIAKLRYVPCIIHEDLKDPLAIEEALIQANKQREKTAEQKTKEFKRLKEIEAKRDKKRLKTSTGGANPRPTVKLSTKPRRPETPRPPKTYGRLSTNSRSRRHTGRSRSHQPSRSFSTPWAVRFPITWSRSIALRLNSDRWRPRMTRSNGLLKRWPRDVGPSTWAEYMSWNC